jgi:hypothetical protein
MYANWPFNIWFRFDSGRVLLDDLFIELITSNHFVFVDGFIY